jgi:hypothetical protein
MASNNDQTLAEKVLAFFNAVNDPYEIRYQIKDDPNFGTERPYGISLSTANNIMAERATLGGEFKTIGEIDAAPGVGSDTLHNILYSFQTLLAGVESTPWVLAYAHNQNGARTAGDKNALIAAVRDGQPVRVLMDSGDLQYVMEAEGLWVRYAEVYAQNNSSVSTAFDNTVLKFQPDSYYWMVVVSTHGDRDMIRWSVGAHTLKGQSHDRVAMKWFVRALPE